MSVKSMHVNGTEYLMLHVAQPTVNGRRCNQYEVRRELDGQDAYHQYGDVYVPVGRSLQEHMEWWANAEDGRSFAEWDEARRHGDVDAA